MSLIEDICLIQFSLIRNSTVQNQTKTLFWSLFYSLHTILASRFWDMDSGKCYHVLRDFSCSLDPNSQILSCAIDYRRGLLALGTYDGYIHVAKI